MSNIVKRLAKRAHKREFLKKWNRHKDTLKNAPKKYKSFNIFTQDGQNLVVKSDIPMTLEMAQFHYKALSISGNE